jgi:hypothetical protein
MSISINPAYAHCERQDCYVSLEQTEGQCRDRHKCSDSDCPLEKEFGQQRFSRALSMLAAGFASAVEPAKKG